MCRAKKPAFAFVSLALLIVCLCQMVSAIELSPHASDYLDGYGAAMYPGTSRGTVRVEFTVSATEDSDYVGVSQLIIYNSDGSRAATIKGSVVNGLLAKDTVATMGHYTYFGKPGASYYAMLTMYAERDGGSDSRQYLTNTSTAPS